MQDHNPRTKSRANYDPRWDFAPKIKHSMGLLHIGLIAGVLGASILGVVVFAVTR